MNPVCKLNWRSIIRWPGKVSALQFSQVLRQGVGIVIAILLARSSLDVAVIGGYEQLLYIGFVLSFFWISGLIQGFLPIFGGLSETDQSRFMTGAYWLFLVTGGLILLLFFCWEEALLTILVSQDHLDYFRLYLIFWAVNLPAHLLEYYYLLRDKNAAITRFALFSSLGQLAAMGLPVLAQWPFIYCFYGLIALALARHLWLLLFLWREGSWSPDRELLKRWLTASVPLLLYALLGGMNQVFDSWLVNFWYGGDEQVFAVFRYGAKELPLAMAMANALSLALIPEIARDLQAGMAQLKRQTARLLHFLFPVSIGLMLTSDYLFNAFFTETFAGSAAIFNVYLLILTNRLTFPHTVMIGLRKNGMMAVVSVVEFMANVLLSLWLVGLYGLWGIALGTVLAYWVEKVVDMIYLWWKHRIRPGQYIPLRWYLIYSAALLLSFYLMLDG